MVVYTICYYTGLQYQSPPPLPGCYVTRTKLLNEIITAILTSDTTPTIGTTVTIRGIGGTGKSTLAKAVCHYLVIKKHFPDGFLWISLTPPVGSPASMLKKLYATLTNEQIDGDTSFMLNKLKSLLAPHKHLVILDDVWEIDDVMIFVDLFINYKIVMTTRKMDVTLKIPPKKSFNINKMDICEAIQVLTLNIIETKELSPSSYNAVSELANNLYCWPLLLSLVHGQLYVHCIEWGELYTNAVSIVQQKLFDKGMTAFDSEKDNREEAVKASITLSLDLLQEDEESLLYHAISSWGIGSKVSKQSLLNKSHMNTEQFNKCSIALWSHGLVTFSRVTLFSSSDEACVEVHDVIAQYILDEMPYKFCKVMDIDSIIDSFNEIDFTEVNSGQKYLLYVDEYILPCWIKFLAIGPRAAHMLFMSDINQLIEAHPKLLETNTMMKLFKDTQSLPIKKVYEGIKDNCRAIQSLLANNRHDEAIAWFSNYFDNHPIVTTHNKIDNFYHNLRKECSHDPEILAIIDNNSWQDINGLKVMINKYIMLRAQVVFMMSSNDEIVKCV